MTRTLTQPTLTYLTTPLAACPYLEGRQERKVLTSLNVVSSPQLLHALSLSGFRRSHHLAYAPACPGCNACISVRIPVATFEPGRTLKRMWRRHRTLRAAERPPIATEEQFELFQRYVQTRHTDGDMAGMTEPDYMFMIEDTPVDSQVVEFRDPDAQDILVGACLTDRFTDGLSAVYSFFDPDLDGGGNFMILWLVERARQLDLPYVYLGYFIENCSKMAYKSRFRPLEGLIDGQWVEMPPP